MSFVTRTQMSTKAYTGAVTFGVDEYRNSFHVQAVGGSITVEVGGGGGVFTIAANEFYEPLVIPTSEITITGNCVVGTVGSTHANTL